ncbi:hypothetical protein D9Q98_007197 [Chlorella vulgaris]|uniref:C2 domain-containing protein n=2 Tax=Chlorella vulgaris TaxID=3077 RepID=A0A9D4YUW9_CHLVU|nr:hypothetical protein D9Q98_007197 [Chlorella vulgaris]
MVGLHLPAAAAHIHSDTITLTCTTRAAAERLATRSHQLDELLNSSQVWRPRWLGSSRVVVQGVSLGHTPPRITAIKAVAQREGNYAVQRQLALDCAFAWSSDLEVKLLFYLFRGWDGCEGEGSMRHRALRFFRRLIPRAMFLKIGVRQVVVSGTARLTLAPLIEQLPVVGAVRVSLMGPPDFAYHTSVFGGNPFMLPGVEAWLNSFIRTSVLAPFLFPGGYDVPLPGAPGSPAARQEPEGLLEVQLIEAVNLPRMDFWGSKADPYCRVEVAPVLLLAALDCRLWVRESSKFTSSVKSRTLNPVWNEEFTLIVHAALYQTLNLVVYDSDALLHDEEIGRAAVPLNSLDASPGAASDLWLPLMRPYSSRRSSRKQQPSVRSGRSSLAQPAGGSPAAGSSPAAASCEDTARHWGALFRRKGSDTQQRQQRQGPDLHRAAGFDRLAQLVPGVPVPVQECALHVRVSYVPFTREEIDVAMQMGRPGIVSILRRLSRVSRVPELLRSGVLTIYLERAEGLTRKRQAGFTKGFKVKVTVGDHISKVTERGKVSFQHRRDPAFDERLELIVDGDTAAAEASQIELEVWVSHFLRPDSFKGRAVVPLREVQSRRRLRGSWPLQDASSGSLTMELSWRAVSGMY